MGSASGSKGALNVASAVRWEVVIALSAPFGGHEITMEADAKYGERVWRGRRGKWENERRGRGYMSGRLYIHSKERAP